MSRLEQDGMARTLADRLVDWFTLAAVLVLVWHLAMVWSFAAGAA